MPWPFGKLGRGRNVQISSPTLATQALVGNAQVAVELNAALTNLMTNPLQFLGGNYITIAGSSISPSGLSVFRMSRDSFENPRYMLGGTPRVPAFSISFQQSDPNAAHQLTSGIAGTMNYIEFRAYYVGMRQMSDRQSNTHFTLPQNGAATLMITSQLSGCTFGYGSQMVGGCCVTHLQPEQRGIGAARIDNPALKAQALVSMPGNGSLATRGHVFQKEVDYNEKASVVGVCGNNGIWSFFAQLQSGGQLMGATAI